MASKAYAEILTRAQTELTEEEVRRLAAVLSSIAVPNGSGKRGITGLRGLGKELWADIDADLHVAQERESWDG